MRKYITHKPSIFFYGDWLPALKIDFMMALPACFDAVDSKIQIKHITDAIVNHLRRQIWIISGHVCKTEGESIHAHILGKLIANNCSPVCSTEMSKIELTPALAHCNTAIMRHITSRMRRFIVTMSKALDRESGCEFHASMVRDMKRRCNYRNAATFQRACFGGVQ